jgi:hypothetical protein
LTRRHSRASLVAVAALAAGAFSTAGALAATAPRAEAAGNVTPSAHVAVAAQLDSVTVPTGTDVPRASDWAASFASTNTATDQSSAAHVPIAHAWTAQPLMVQTSATQAQAAAATAAKAAPAVAAKGQAAPARPARPQATPAHAAASQAARAHRTVPRPAASHPAASHPAASHPAASHPAASHPAPAAPMKPYFIYDSVTPSSIPGGQQVATYANGAYAQSASSVAGRGHVLWIDTNGSDPRADVLDVEPGDATPAGAAQWAKAKLSSQPSSIAIIYTMLSDWQAVKGSVSALPPWMQAKVHYWIADPTGVNHVVPGSNATQWYWGQNYDITTANPGFES